MHHQDGIVLVADLQRICPCPDLDHLLPDQTLNPLANGAFCDRQVPRHLHRRSASITLLQDDGRRPTVEMARHLAVAEGTVRKRIERLIREKVIQIGAWADPLKIGYQNYAVLMMHVDLRDLERAAEQLSKMPEIFFLGTCTGGFDLF